MVRFLAVAVLLVAPLVQLGDAAPDILEALRLPALTAEARRAGVPEEAVRDVLDALRRRGLPAADAALAVGAEVDAVRDGAPTNDFGRFVQAQLETGLRGRALADAIRAEHLARGIGRGRNRQ